MNANHRFRTLAVTVVFITFTSLIVFQTTFADIYRLSLPAPIHVANFKISPDDQYVVYISDPNGDGVTELYSVPITGPAGDSLQLSRDLPGDVHILLNFIISPDSQRVVYKAEADLDGCYDLFSVPIRGTYTETVQINKPFTVSDGWCVTSYQISSDSSTVVYKADPDSWKSLELYAVPIQGPWESGYKLNKSLPLNGDVESFSISGDNGYVVYIADQDVDYVHDLYAVPLAGPASAGMKIGDPLPEDRDFASFTISPDSQKVVYTADLDTDGVEELYSTEITGTVGVKLNIVVDLWDIDPPGGGGGYQISPDSSYVTYRIETPDYHFRDLYSVPIAGPASASVKLNEEITYLYGSGVNNSQISPDSTRVLYWASKDSPLQELFSVPITGPGDSSVKLNKDLNSGEYLRAYQIGINYFSPDSSRVVYIGKQDGAPNLSLYSVPAAGSSNEVVKLSLDFSNENGEVHEFLISPDNNDVLYTADLEYYATRELYSAPISGPAIESYKLNGEILPNYPSVDDFFITQDSQVVVYTAAQESYYKELYAVDHVPPPWTYQTYLPLVIQSPD